MKFKFQKFWWLWAIAGLVVIFYALPELVGVQFAMHPSTSVKAGDCYENKCMTACGYNTFGTWSCTANRDYTCSSKADCTKLSEDKNIVVFTAKQEWGDAGYANIIKKEEELLGKEGTSPYKAPTDKPKETPDTTKNTETGEVVKASSLSCKDNDKLWLGEEVWDECGGNGCTIKQGVAQCKSGISGFFDDELIGGIPNYLLILAAIFLLMMFSMGAGRRQ